MYDRDKGYCMLGTKDTTVTSLVCEGIKCRREILWPLQLRTLVG